MLFNPSMSVISSDYNVVFCHPGKAKLKGARLTLPGGETEKGGRGGQEEGRRWGQEEESAVQHGGSLWRLPGQGQNVEHMLSYSRGLTAGPRVSRAGGAETRQKTNCERNQEDDSDREAQTTGYWEPEGGRPEVSLGSTGFHLQQELTL